MGLKPKTSVGGVWIFSGTTYCNRKVIGLTLVGSTWIFLLNPCMPVSLTEKTSSFTVIARLKIYHLHFHHCATAAHRHFNPSSMQDVCHMNLV